MSDVQIDFVGSAEQLLGEYQKTHRENERLKKNLQEVKTNSREAAREQRQMAREAKALFESTRTPLEKHNAQLSRLGDLLRKGHIDQETYTRAVQRSNQTLRDNNIAEQERARSQTTSARVTRGMVSQLGELAVAYGLSTRAISAFVQANRQAIEASDQAAAKYHAVGRRFRIQSGLRGLEAENAQSRIEGTAAARGIDLSTVGDIATQLVSSEFSVGEASGGSLDEFLRLLNASSAAGEAGDPEQLANSIAKFLSSQGLDKNQANLARVGRQAHVASKDGTFNFAALGELAKVGSTLAPALSVEEQIAAMSSLVDVMPAPDAATGMRNVIGRLMTSRESAPRRGALERLGLTPGDVDFVGEDYDTVFGKLGGAIQNVPEEERAGILMKLFEEKGVASARVMINSRDKTRRRRIANQDDSSFLEDVVLAESGPDRGAVRQQIAREALQRQSARNDSLIAGELDVTLQGRGASPFRRQVAGAAYQTSRYFGLSPQVSLQAGSFVGGEEAGVIEGQAGLRQLSPLAGEQNQNQVDRWSAAIRQNNQLLQQNNEEMRRQTNGGAGAGGMPERQLGRSN